jgi:chorismate mutase
MTDINDLRNAIDVIDNNILGLIHERMTLVDKIGDFKVKNNIVITDKSRENQLIETLILNNNKVDKQLIVDLWTVLLNHSKTRQSLRD